MDILKTGLFITIPSTIRIKNDYKDTQDAFSKFNQALNINITKMLYDTKNRIKKINKLQ